jgi:hypothetical protein
MSPLLASTIQGRPFTIPIERYAIRTLVHFIQFLQIIIFDSARSLYIEKSKCNLVFCVRFRKEVFEGAPVKDVEFACVPPVCYSEEDSILFALDLVLYFNMLRQSIAQDTLMQRCIGADSHNLRSLAQWH